MADVLVVEAVDVGRVDERDPSIQRGVDHTDALFLRRPTLNR
jgi:hypothetical protein